MVDLSKHLILDDAGKQRRIRSTDELKLALKTTESPVVVLRNDKQSGMSMIGISRPKQSTEPEFAYANQTGLDMTTIGQLIGRRLFSSADALKPPRQTNGTLGASIRIQENVSTEDKLSESEYEVRFRHKD